MDKPEGIPKLVLFAACEKVILGQDNTASIITVMESLAVLVGKDPIPPDALLPMKWNVIALWRRTPDTVGKTFIQRVEMLRPDGIVVGGGVSDFTVTDTLLHYRLLVDFAGLPIGQEGDVLLKLYLKEAGNVDEWVATADYFIQIGHKRIEDEVKDESAATEKPEVG